MSTCGKSTPTRLSGLLFFSLLVVATWAPLVADTEESMKGSANELRIPEPEVLVVVGSRRAERSTTDSPVPVDVLEGDRLQQRSGTDVLDVLASVIPSYNVNREPISDAATLVRPTNLRGLPADSTLVLVNGKRRHRSAVVGEFVGGINKGAQGVDMAPLSGVALKQVEVLRDGASAQYGSNAIAGVLNLQLVDDPEIRQLNLNYGSTFEGDGNQIVISGIAGMELGVDGFLTAAFEFKDTEPTSRGSQDPQASRLIDEGFVGVPNPAVIWGAPQVDDDLNLILNSGMPTGNGEIYAFGNLSQTTVDGSFFYRNPNTRVGVFADGAGQLLVADLTPNDANDCPSVPVVDGLADPAALRTNIDDPNCFIFNEFFPGGFTPRFGGDVNDRFVAFGWRSNLNENRKLAVSFSTGRNEVVYRIRNTVNASYGPNTPLAFNLGSQIQSEWMFNIDYVMSVEVDAASPLNIAIGAQYHDETFEMIAGDRESWAPGGFEDQGYSVGSNGFQGFADQVAGKFGRDSLAAYVDLELDITDSLIASTALRYENYSDFGSTVNGKVASRFALTPHMAIRGSVSSGFRAPSTGQSNLRRAATTFQDGMLVESLTEPSTSPLAVLKGGRQLTAEESLSWSVGAVIDIWETDVTLDWYFIGVDGRIALTQQSLTDEDQQRLIDQGVPGAGTIRAVSFFVNDIDSETSGIDFVVSTSYTPMYNTITATFALNITDTEITDPGVTLNSQTARELEDALPQSRYTLTLDYERHNWLYRMRVNRYGEAFELLFFDPGIPVETDPITLVDLEVTRNIGENSSMTLGIDNVFDVQPDKHEYAGVAGYLGADFPLSHPAGFNGGNWFIRYQANW